jgi:hypothetical protein
VDAPINNTQEYSLIEVKFLSRPGWGCIGIILTISVRLTTIVGNDDVRQQTTLPWFG